MINFNAKRYEQTTSNLMEKEKDSKIKKQFHELHSTPENIEKEIQFSLLKSSENQRNISSLDEMSTNDNKNSCNSDLIKNWQGKFKLDELRCDQFSLNLDINDISYFVEMPSSDIEVYLDSNLSTGSRELAWKS